MEEIKNEIYEMRKSIDEMTILFYQQKREEGYLQLNNTLLVLSKGINSIFQYKLENNNINIDEVHINNVLVAAMQALEAKDTILFSDILRYDLKELLEDILEII